MLQDHGTQGTGTTVFKIGGRLVSENEETYGSIKGLPYEYCLQLQNYRRQKLQLKAMHVIVFIPRVGKFKQCGFALEHLRGLSIILKVKIG